MGRLPLTLALVAVAVLVAALLILSRTTPAPSGASAGNSRAPLTTPEAPSTPSDLHAPAAAGAEKDIAARRSPERLRFEADGFAARVWDPTEGFAELEAAQVWLDPAEDGR